jgi:PEP-CTERM motif
MRKISIALALAVVGMGSALMSESAVAQGAPQTRTIPVTFTGVVANDVTRTIYVPQPDGTPTRFTGAVPDYPYRPGDTVTISFNAIVPTRAAYEAGGALANVASADGIYRIAVSNPFYNGNSRPLGIGNSTIADPSGPINPIPTFGQPTNTRMTLVYDSIADSYSIDFGNNGGLLSSAYNAPTYNYDPAAQTLTPCQGTTCAYSDSSFLPNTVLTGSATQVVVNRVTVPQSVPNDPFRNGIIAGFFDLFINGSWNLPSYTPGGPVDVPEPAMTLLFAGGAAAVIRRRRRRTAA